VIDVAVVIVTYRVAELTIECLRSIQPEVMTPGVNIRVIVVDNASGDAAKIRSAIDKNGWSSWVSLLVAERNGGFAYGNNLAFRHAYETSPPNYFHLLNPDAQLWPGAIVALVGFLETHDQAGIAGSCFVTDDGKPAPFAFRFPSLLSEIELGMGTGVVTRLLARSAVLINVGSTDEKVDGVSGASMMVRRSLLDEIGGLDERFFLYFEETEFAKRASLIGSSTWYVAGSRVRHVAGQSTKIKRGSAPKNRLPDYWFASRRTWFLRTYGVLCAIAIDMLAVIAHVLGDCKRMILCRPSRRAPFYVRDLLRHSPIWRANRVSAFGPTFPPRPAPVAEPGFRRDGCDSNGEAAQ
jgi:GT2 family glycosyltransferase